MIDKGADICWLPTTQYAAKTLLQRMVKKKAEALRIQKESVIHQLGFENTSANNSDCCICEHDALDVCISWALNGKTCTKSLLGLAKHRLNICFRFPKHDVGFGGTQGMAQMSPVVQQSDLGLQPCQPPQPFLARMRHCTRAKHLSPRTRTQ